MTKLGICDFIYENWCFQNSLSLHDYVRLASSTAKVWLRRRISHAPNEIIQFGACEMRRLNQDNQFDATQMN